MATDPNTNDNNNNNNINEPPLNKQQKQLTSVPNSPFWMDLQFKSPKNSNKNKININTNNDINHHIKQLSINKSNANSINATNNDNKTNNNDNKHSKNDNKKVKKRLTRKQRRNNAKYNNNNNNNTNPVQTNDINASIHQGLKRKSSRNKLNSLKNSNKFKNKASGKYNNNITDDEEEKIYKSLLCAVQTHNKLSDNELIKIFQNALYKLNAAWFRQNLSSFFNNNSNDNTDNNDMGDIITFVLRLFVLNMKIASNKHHVPFRYLLLDLISPSLHSRHSAHRNANLIKPLPQITKVHQLKANEIFSLWILQKTKDIPVHNDNNDVKDDNDGDNDISLDLLSKYHDNTLDYLTPKEMECLFHVFKLSCTISLNIRHKISDQIYHYLNHLDNAASAVEWTIYFDLIYDIPYDIILCPLLRSQSTLHYAINYIDHIEHSKLHSCNINYIKKVKKYIISTISSQITSYRTTISASRAMKLINKWNFNILEFDELRIQQIQNHLKWTIFCGHIDDYADLICKNEDILLKYFVINQCRIHPSTYNSCIKWAKQWNLCDDINVKASVDSAIHWINNNKAVPVTEYSEKKQNKTNFIIGFDDLAECTIDDNQIIWVDSPETILLARDVLINDSTLKCIGLDLELMSVQLPILNTSNTSWPSACQILQIGTDSICFLFDLQKYNNLIKYGIDDLFSDIFCEISAIKIGMGWQCDLRNLRKQFPDSLAFKSPCQPYLELQEISKHIRNNNEFKLKYNILNEKIEKKIKNKFKKIKSKEGGLTKLVRWCLNKKLNKFEQLSNWSNRPLRNNQLKYAALDSIVECWLYNKFIEWQKQNILPDINGFCDHLYGTN